MSYINLSGQFISFGELQGISLGIPSDNQSLKYNSSNLKWENAFISHDELINIQGGSIGEYNHLTNQQASLISGLNGVVSATRLTDITVTDNGNGTVTTSSCLVVLKESLNEIALAQGFNISGITSSALSINSRYLLVADYNSGSPILSVRPYESSGTNGATIISLGLIIRGISGDCYWLNFGTVGLNSPNKITRRLTETDNLLVKTSGGLVSSSAGRYVQITAGVYYAGLSRIPVPSFNSSGTDRFSTMYGDSTAGFTELNNVAQLNNTQYWNPATNSLTALSAGRYSNRWIFQLIDSPNEVYEWIGTAQFTSIASARDSLLTTDLPVQLQQATDNQAVLIAKVIVRQGQSNIIEVANIINTSTQSVATSVHNELSGLQGGDVDEYYHLTSTQHTNLTNGASGSFTSADGKTVTVTNGIITSIV